MARKPRLHYKGAVYDVMVRGNGGQNIFSDDEDRYRFFLFLQEGVDGGKQRYVSEARGMIAHWVREISGLSLTDLSRRMKRDVSSLSHAADRITRHSKEDSDLAKRRRLLAKALYETP